MQAFSDALVQKSFPDEFFSEREVRIPGDEAATFYATLAEGLDAAPHYEHTTTGNLAEFKRGRNTFIKQPEVTFFFRGQSNASYGLNSSLYRMIAPAIKPGMQHRDIERLLNEAENRVLAAAREHGLVRGLTALECLTVLQHHGAPTRLIDVSSDWRVALYFAVETDDATDGRLFAVTAQHGKWLRFPRATGDGLAWQQEKVKQWDTDVVPVLLPFSDARMVAQRGFFLTGGLVTNAHGHRQYRRSDEGGTELNQEEMRLVSTLAVKFAVPRHRENLAATVNQFEEAEKKARSEKPRFEGRWSSRGFTVRIPAQWKRELRALLAKDGLTPDTIYPPLDEVRRLLQHVARTR